MYIRGIGSVRKNEAMSILTKEGKKAVESGHITSDVLGRMYKLEQVKKLSKIGSCGDTFAKSYEHIPDDLKEELTPMQLGKLVDAFYECKTQR